VNLSFVFTGGSREITLRGSEVSEMQPSLTKQMNCDGTLPSALQP
jgi:hypothetical protein